MIKKDEIKAVANEYEKEIIDLSRQYNSKLKEIQDDKTLTEIGKEEKQLKEYEIHKMANESIEEKYESKIEKMIESRKQAANKKVEANKSLKLSDSLAAADISYIEYILNNGDELDIKGVAEKYDYNPYVLNMINLKGRQQPRGGLIINNPYEEILNEKITDYVGFNSRVVNKPIKSLWG